MYSGEMKICNLCHATIHDDIFANPSGTLHFHNRLSQPCFYVWLITLLKYGHVTRPHFTSPWLREPRDRNLKKRKKPPRKK